MASRRAALGLGLGALLLGTSGCERGAAPGSSPAGAPSSSQSSVPRSPGPPASPSGAAQAPAPASAPPPAGGKQEGGSSPEAESLQLLELRATSAIKDKEPTDTLRSAAPGKRLYVHLRLRNRTGFTRVCELTFRVGGVVRTTVSLEVEPSWNFRTWAYATLLPSDREGSLDLHVEDDTGAVLADRSYPITRR